MSLPAKLRSRTYLALLILSALSAPCLGQIRPYRAAPPCETGQCGSPLVGPCIPERGTYGYVPPTWRRWPTVQVASAPVREELPAPTPAKPSRPTEGNVPATEPERTPQLPLTPELPSGAAPAAEPSGGSLEPPFGSAPTTPSFGDRPQVPIFGDEPQAPPSAASPLGSPFGDDPPEPPAEETAPPMETAPAIEPENAPPRLPEAPTPAPTTPSSGMPFEMGTPPSMPQDDPFKDDPVQDPLPPTNSGTGLDGTGYEPEGADAPPMYPQVVEDELAAREANNWDAEVPAETPRLLRADGASLDGGGLEPSRLEVEPAGGPNPLRQVSHPIRRTSATERVGKVAVPEAPRSQGVWRHNPLRAK